MHFQICYRNIDHLSDLTEYARLKIREKIKPLSDGSISAEISIYKTEDEHVATCQVQLAPGTRMVEVQHRDDFAYVCIDGLVDKLAMELRRNEMKPTARLKTKKISRYVPLRPKSGKMTPSMTSSIGSTELTVQ